MQISLSFIRVLFLGLCMLLASIYAASETSNGTYYISLILGLLAGTAFWGLTISLEILLKRFNLRSFNIATIGLICGYLMGGAILLILQSVIDVSHVNITSQTEALLRMSVLLFTAYFGMVMTAKAAEEIYVSIPFFRLKPNTQKKKDLILDAAALLDPRIIDLASSGLLDHCLILPRFVFKECSEQLDSADEIQRSKARKILDIIKKLENIPSLEMRYTEIDFNDVKDLTTKLARTARQMDANILTADSARLHQSTIEGIRLINLHLLSCALKPLAQAGECIQIKIQRYGKEPRQGIGYLEDGTMVVVNGGAEYIGETIRTQVLSAKHTASGRMIFCNAIEDGGMLLDQLLAHAGASETSELLAKNNFAL